MPASIDRRAFLRTATVLFSSAPLTGRRAAGPFGNSLPHWRGFNLLDFFSARAPGTPDRSATTNDDLRWIADWGFDFVRLPMAYPRYVRYDPSRPITIDEVYRFDTEQVERIENLVYRANRHGLHVSINLHRAPGYCVNAGFTEPFNLWQDAEAQRAFVHHWSMWAERFKHLTPDQISFDLVNEPSARADMNDQHSERKPVPGAVYRKVAADTLEAIRKHNPDHRVIADGNDVGAVPIPEIADLDIGQSCRGYYPGLISHYRAPWAVKNPEESPLPRWPGEMNGRLYGRADLERFYQPWIELMRQGVGVHCGECGCWSATPHDVFLAWFGDVLDILTENGIGYALWNFRGAFGVLDSGRADVAYENWYGHALDRKLLALLQKH